MPSFRNLPPSFAERGCHVGFVAPGLLAARARRAPGGVLELVVPWAVSRCGTLVLPWTEVPSAFSMEAYDRRLHRALLAEAEPTPASIRRVTLRVALSGACGVARQAAAETLIHRDRQQFADICQRVAAAVIRSDQASRERCNTAETGPTRRSPGGSLSGTGPSEISPTDKSPANKNPGDEAVQRALDGAGQMLGISGQAVLDRLRDVAGTIAPVGLPDQPGRLRQAVDHLLALRSRQMSWVARHPSSPAIPSVMACIEATGGTIDLIRSELRLFSRVAGDGGRLLAAWPQVRAALTDCVRRIEWLLDGWETIGEAWLSATSSTERPADVISLVAQLPPVPLEQYRRQAVIDPAAAALVRLPGARLPASGSLRALAS